jgi:hypothetical protein
MNGIRRDHALRVDREESGGPDHEEEVKGLGAS